jgi:hypothetical protein
MDACPELVLLTTKALIFSQSGGQNLAAKYSDGYVVYPLDIDAIVNGAGDTYGSALADIRSALCFHVEPFSAKVLNPNF